MILISQENLLEKLQSFPADQFLNIASVRNLIQDESEAIIRCEKCKHYKPSAITNRMMCFRKDIDGVFVCYDFKPDDWCRYAERKEE